MSHKLRFPAFGAADEGWFGPLRRLGVGFPGGGLGGAIRPASLGRNTVLAAVATCSLDELIPTRYSFKERWLLDLAF